MAQDIDFFFFYGSTYTYLTVMRIEEAAARAGVAVRWRPFNVRQIMVEQNNIPFRDKPAKARYMWRDIERRAARHGIPFAGQPPYPVDPELLANRVGLIAAEQGWCPEYTQATYRDWFLDGSVAGQAENVARILRRLGKDAGALIEQANSQAVRDRFDAGTEAARGLGIFGSPTFAVGAEIFWGDDRLEDALDWALGRAAVQQVNAGA
jgi:2-hydroxychromene-2-carboxylate isomerase